MQGLGFKNIISTLEMSFFVVVIFTWEVQLLIFVFLFLLFDFKKYSSALCILYINLVDCMLRYVNCLKVGGKLSS